MMMIYDSDAFTVVHLIANENPGDQLIYPPRHCFEIVDKREGKELLLDGEWANLFHDQCRTWNKVLPAQAEVEALLEAYCILAQLPMVVH